MTKLNLINLLTSITAGDFDNDLSKIRDAMEFRMSITVRDLRSKLRVGQPVYFSETVNPKYLRGVKAFIRKINTKRVVVDLETPAGRFSRGIRCPLSILTTEAP